ncbi:MAG: hypothetical protein HYZ65_05875 [Burkholderiales bacterium]|nr:hypothetical protein [Burkholderiales bacterium]
MDALPVKQLDVNAGQSLHWSGDSKRIYFSLGDELFSRELKDAFAFVPGAPAKLPKPVEQGVKIGFQQAADKPSGTTVISGARIVAMKGDEVIEDGRIALKDNRIVAVGKAAERLFAWTWRRVSPEQKMAQALNLASLEA